MRKIQPSQQTVLNLPKFSLPTFPASTTWLELALLMSREIGISFYVEDIQSHMDASPLSSEFSFEIPTLLAKGEFPLEVSDTKPGKRFRGKIT